MKVIIIPAALFRGGRRSLPFWVLSLTLVAAFMMGGGSRADIRSLILLRPLSALILAYGLSGLTWEQVKAQRFLFGMGSAILALPLVQLIPLPPSIWSTLPGRELIVAIDRAASLGAVWRPISLVPSGTWNAFFSLLLPFAVLVLGVRLSRDEKANLLPVLVGLGLLSGLLAMLQLGGSKDGPFYFYEVTNNGAAVGLFANRNHQAVFLTTLFPMLAAFASANWASSIDRRIRGIVALASAMVLVPLLLVTGSRAGLVVGLIALISIPFIYGFPRTEESRPRHLRKPLIWGTAIVVVLAGLLFISVWFGRAEAFDRLVQGLSSKELRYRAWLPLVDMIWRYFPIGTGLGSFREVFQIDEPRSLLATTQFFHAHNDWLELALTGGLPAMLLIGAAAIAFARKVIYLQQSWRDNNRDHVLACAGTTVLSLFVVASSGDYPLRVPSISCVVVVAVLWMSSFRTRAHAPKTN